MEFILDTNIVKDAISRIFDVAPSKASDGSLLGVKIETIENNVIFSINSSDIVAYDLVPSATIKPGSCVVVLSELFRAVSGFSSLDTSSNTGTESISFKSGSQSLTISAISFYNGAPLKHRRTIKFLDTAVRNIKSIPEEGFIEVSLGQFVEGLKKVVVSSSSGTEVSGFSGVLISFLGDKIKFCSTNSVCLTEVLVSSPRKYESLSFVLDGSFVNKVIKIFMKYIKDKEEGNIKFVVSNKRFIVRYDSFIMGVPLSTSVFPDYSFLLLNKDKSFIIDSKLFLDNLRNIMFNSDKDDDFRLTLNFHEDSLLIKTQSCENEGIPIENIDRHSLHIDFNAHLLERCLRNIEHPFVSISYKDRNSPIIIRPVVQDNINILSVVAPLK